MSRTQLAPEPVKIKQKMAPEHVDGLWLLMVLGAPFAALAWRHGYSESLRDGDFFLFGISAMVAVLFEWFIEQPASWARFFGAPGVDEEPGYIQLLAMLALLGWNCYLFADLPGDHASWHLNLALWVTFSFVAGLHTEKGVKTAARFP